MMKGYTFMIDGDINKMHQTPGTGTTTLHETHKCTAAKRWRDKADKKLADGDNSMWVDYVRDAFGYPFDENGNPVGKLTDEEWRKKYTDPDSKTGRLLFARNTQRDYAVERSFYPKAKRKKPSDDSVSIPDDIIQPKDGSEEFVPQRKGPEPEYVSHSDQLYKDIITRLQNFERYYGSFSKRVIINQLLDDSLAKYGF